MTYEYYTTATDSGTVSADVQVFTHITPKSYSIFGEEDIVFYTKKALYRYFLLNTKLAKSVNYCFYETSNYINLYSFCRFCKKPISVNVNTIFINNKYFCSDSCKNEYLEVFKNE